ncbi:MAG: GWxTD domain-containing protein [candidate division KSB1 bacterium]|nr:GWxTD domain-containing protein [candidate division KSB1 bacterium]
MRKAFICLFIVISTLIEPIQALQVRDMASSRRKTMFGKNLFVYQTYNFADSTDQTKSLMEFHLQVVNDLLTFIKTKEGTFRARYELNVVIRNDKQELLAEQSQSHRVIVATFAETNSRENPHHHSFSFSLAPGRYLGLIRLIDLESNEQLNEEVSCTFRQFNRDRLHLSDLVFLDRVDSTQSGRSFRPNVLNLFNDLSSAFSAYVEIYPPHSADSIQVQTVIFGKNQKLFEGKKSYAVRDRSTIPVLIPFRQHLTQPGDYGLLVNAVWGSQSAKVQRLFSVSWSNVTLRENNIDLAIEQLAVIARKRTIDAMRQADPEEKRRLYEQFWKERDPTPATERNELREEYFRRIDFCNMNFSEVSAGRQGWETDRGRIYLVYGPPDAVDRQEMEMSVRAVEVWHYNRLNRRYYFADRTGDGTYRLIKVE